MIRIRPHLTAMVPGGVASLWTRASDVGLSGILLVGLGMAVSWGLRALLGLAAYPVEVFLGVGVLLALCLTPIVRSCRTGTFDVFDLVISFSAIYFLYFGVRALVLLLNPEILTAKTPHPSIMIAGLPLAVWYGDIGMAAYLAGYRMSRHLSPLRERFFKGSPGVDARIIGAAAFTVYLLGWLARMPELIRGWFVVSAVTRYAANIPPTIQTVSYFSILGVFGYALSLVALCVPGGDHPVPRLMAAVFTPLEFLYAILIGSKFHLGMLISILLIIPHYLRRRISPPAALITIAVFVFVVIPVIAVYRNIAVSEDIPLRSFGRQLPHIASQMAARLRSFTPAQYFETSMRASTDRLSGIDGVAVTVRQVPIVEDYLHGASLVWVFKILVPTIVQPGKNAALAHVLGRVPHLFGYPDTRQGGIAITSVAEFYWNFGLPGVLVGMWFVGLLQGTLVTLLLRPPSPLGVFAYAVIWTWMVIAVEGWAVFVYGNALRLGGLAALISLGILWLARWKPHPTAAVEQARP